ncbi:MAG: hypothetical protein LBT74_05365 [Acidobacteriota bacterium]|nr:hypothetical protein [Acidobacteriota bacterium]
MSALSRFNVTIPAPDFRAAGRDAVAGSLAAGWRVASSATPGVGVPDRTGWRDPFLAPPGMGLRGLFGVGVCAAPGIGCNTKAAPTKNAKALTL